MIIGTFLHVILLLTFGAFLISSTPQIITSNPYGRSFNNGYGPGLSGYGGGYNGLEGGVGLLGGGLGGGVLGGGYGGLGGIGGGLGGYGGGLGGYGNQGYGYWSDASSSRFTPRSNHLYWTLFLSMAVTGFLTLSFALP